MARLNRRYRQQAAQQARAEVQPVIKSKRRGLRHEVEALRSEEDPLNTGLENAAATIRHSGLTGADRDRVLESIAQQQAAVPESITSQITSAREDTGGEISDLQTQEAQQRASILSSLLAKAAETQQAAHAEVAAENRQRSGDIKQAELEKALGLGSYDQTPSPEEAVQIPKIEAETDLLGKNGGLTPSEARTVHNENAAHHEDHATAAHFARQLTQEARSGRLEKAGISTEPKDWTPEIWNELVSKVSELGSVPVPVAEKAVGAVKDHFTPPAGLPGLFGVAAKAATGAVTHAAPTHGTPPASLLSLLPELSKTPRY